MKFNKVIFAIALGTVIPLNYVFADGYTWPDPYGFSPITNTIYSLNCDNFYRVDPESEDRNVWIFERDACKASQIITRKAVDSRDQNVCNEINEELTKKISQIGGLPSNYGRTISKEDYINEKINQCTSLFTNESILKPSKSIRFIDNMLAGISLCFSFLYLVILLLRKGIRGKLTIMMSGVSPVGLMYYIITTLFLGLFISLPDSVGYWIPSIPPLHDFLFFKPKYFYLIYGIGAMYGLIMLIFVNIFMIGFRKEMQLRDRFIASVFFTFVATPIFFPIGILAALLHVVRTKKLEKIQASLT